MIDATHTVLHHVIERNLTCSANGNEEQALLNDTRRYMGTCAMGPYYHMSITVYVTSAIWAASRSRTA